MKAKHVSILTGNGFKEREGGGRLMFDVQDEPFRRGEEVGVVVVGGWSSVMDINDEFSPEGVF